LKTASLKLTIIETEEELRRIDSSADEFDDLDEKKSVEIEKKPEEKVPEPIDITSLVQSKINEIIPELTKKLVEEVTNNIRKSEIKSDRPSEQSRKSHNEIIHERVTCDGCSKYPIVGHRYKCVICHNFDFCEACEAKGDHPHAFLKIRTPDQAPKVLIASMDDADREGLDINGKFLDTSMIQNLLANFVP